MEFSFAITRFAEYERKSGKINAKRGRNTQNHHIPKHASLEDYSYSTAFEALLGYLYLHKKEYRVKEIINESIKIIEGDNNE